MWHVWQTWHTKSMLRSQPTTFFVMYPNKHCISPYRCVTAFFPTVQNTAWNTDPAAAFIQIESSFSLKGECKCVIYTCLVFYHDKAVHTPGKGAKRNASSSFIHRLSCFIHALVILYHAPLSGRQEAGSRRNKSLIFCFLISFLLPVVSPISLFILHMWLPAC